MLTDGHKWGALLRSLRLEKGLSQRALARRIVWSHSAIAMAETDCRMPSLEFARACDEALGSAGRLLEEAKNEMRRRGILISVAAIPILGKSELAFRGMAEAVSGQNVSIDQWLDRTEEYGRAYLSLGPEAELQERLTQDLLALHGQLSSDRLWTVAAKLMSLKGKMTPAGSAGVGPADWYRLAATASDNSGDVATQTWIRGRAALSLAHEAQEVAMASAFADHALSLSTSPSVGRLNALIARAQIAASKGDRRTALTALSAARHVFDRVGTDGTASDFNVPVWRFHTFASVVLSRLGDKRAASDQDEADRTRPAEFARFATHIELHRGLLLAKTGDATIGVDYARNAVAKLPSHRRSHSLQRMMREVTETAARAIPSRHGGRGD